MDLSKSFTREMIDIIKFIANPAHPEHNLLNNKIVDAHIAFLFTNRNIKNISFRDVILPQRDKPGES